MDILKGIFYRENKKYIILLKYNEKKLIFESVLQKWCDTERGDHWEHIFYFNRKLKLFASSR